MSDLPLEDLPGYGVMRPILDAVTREYRMALTALIEGGKTPTPVEARQVCCWLAEKLKVRLAPVEIGDVLKRHRNTVPKGAATIERRRVEDPWLREMTDRLLLELGGSAQ
jgi:chromosomal replication initiation ATPase DnaA